MSFNYKTLGVFCNYSSLEHSILRDCFFPSFLPIYQPLLSVRKSFPIKDHFNFIRFFNLNHFIFPYFKPKIISKSENYFTFSKIFQSHFLYFFFRNLFKFKRSSKGSFIKISYLDNFTGAITIREPHVAFLVTSPYFDYHTSKINLIFSFSYKNQPSFIYMLVWLFGVR